MAPQEWLGKQIKNRERKGKTNRPFIVDGRRGWLRQSIAGGAQSLQGAVRARLASATCRTTAKILINGEYTRNATLLTASVVGAELECAGASRNLHCHQ